MKKITLLSILLISIFSYSSAQNKWAEYATTIAGEHFSLFEECGDTTVNGSNYTKIYASQYRLVDSTKYSSSLYALTRQMNDSTMYRLLTDTQDHLLYDFTIEVGDTINLLTTIGGFSDFKVTHIDTLVLLSSNRRQITIENIQHGYEDIWVEGIGSIQRGYLTRGNPINIPDAGSNFSCFYSSNLDSIWPPSSIYACLMGSIELSCTETTSIENYEIQSQIIAYPNPFSDKIELTDLPIKGTLSIYNVLGQKIQSQKFSQENLKINTTSFEAGVYFIEIQDSEGKVSSLKMIKQE